MISNANTIDEYINSLPDDRKQAMNKLRKICKANLKGTAEEMSYGMIGYVVPLKIFSSGYHCKPNTPLPFVNIASQKNFIALYHMGVYGSKKLYDWFVAEYPKHCNSKLDMGKSCIRFKKMEDIPYNLIETLLSKMTMEEWIENYVAMLNKHKK